jgi:tellurite resistance protein TerC
MWVNGYILEIIFLIENVFVFHIIVKAFDMPRKMTQQLLFIVVACQICFQMVFYMGLADTLRKLNILPYVLGPWLLYCGFYTVYDDEHKHDFSIHDSIVVKAFKSCLGSRFDTDREMGMKSIYTTKNDTLHMTMAGLCLICLLVADFVLEIDVTIAKIESMQNQYLCFSSSVVASFAVPELFFVARDLFRRFAGLTYAIGCVLIFFGLQMLLHDLFTLPAVVNICVILLMLLLGIIMSVVLGLGEGYEAPSGPRSPTPRQASSRSSSSNSQPDVAAGPDK